MTETKAQILERFGRHAEASGNLIRKMRELLELAEEQLEHTPGHVRCAACEVGGFLFERRHS